MQRRACNMCRTLGSTLHATRNAQHTTRTTYSMQHATYTMQHARSNTPIRQATRSPTGGGVATWDLTAQAGPSRST
jgi:hypothetical protein